jgi:hypothetical protein
MISTRTASSIAIDDGSPAVSIAAMRWVANGGGRADAHVVEAAPK